MNDHSFPAGNGDASEVDNVTRGGEIRSTHSVHTSEGCITLCACIYYVCVTAWEVGKEVKSWDQWGTQLIQKTSQKLMLDTLTNLLIFMELYI